jgi:predicted CoA-substrate-specific enzyme activase
VVVLDDSKPVEYKIRDTGVDPLGHSQELLKSMQYDALVATGYGRHMAQSHLACPVITEIKAYALGAHHYFPKCRTVIDIGGQDSKVIKVNDGLVEDFEMNDRCAAGTGKFLEVMAQTLGFTIDQIGEEALEAERSVSINSMCTVFAESEVISLIARGENTRNIALGLHESVLNRMMGIINRVGVADDVIFAGGVAKNRCMGILLNKKLGVEIRIPDEPQIVGAVGAALVARQAR